MSPTTFGVICRLLLIPVLLTWTISAWAQAPLPAPSGLSSPLATSRQVGLAWTGVVADQAGYLVERKTLDCAWVENGRTPQAAYTDGAIDPFATYVYRVRSYREVDAPGRPGGRELQLSAPSNEITVGPPPVGITTIAAAPADRGLDFARTLSVALDANGDPCLAYTFMDPNGDSANNDSQLFFIAWNRATYRWNPPVLVDVVGEMGLDKHRLEVSLAHDASSGRLAIAYQTVRGNDAGISLAQSTDGGVTWSREIVQPISEAPSANPSLAMAGGTLYLTYHQFGQGLHYRTRSGAGAFTDLLAPKPEGMDVVHENSGVVLDGAGQPAVWYWLSVNGEYRTILAYWRPGDATPVEVADTTVGSDYAAASLAFAGTAPRLLFELRRTEDDDVNLWFTSSSDGRSWTAPAGVPRDGDDYWNRPVFLTLDSTGRAAATIGINEGRGAKLGRPKVVRSDALTEWRVTSPDSELALVGAEVTGRVVFAGNDKLYVPFQNADPGRKIPAGLMLWREP